MTVIISADPPEEIPILPFGNDPDYVPTVDLNVILPIDETDPGSLPGQELELGIVPVERRPNPSDLNWIRFPGYALFG